MKLLYSYFLLIKRLRTTKYGNLFSVAVANHSDKSNRAKMCSFGNWFQKDVVHHVEKPGSRSRKLSYNIHQHPGSREKEQGMGPGCKTSKPDPKAI